MTSRSDRFIDAPTTTLIVGAEAHNLSETMASALAEAGDVVRTLQIKTTEHSLPMTALRVAERLRPELVVGGRRSSHILVLCEAPYAMAVIEGLLRLQLAAALRVDGLVFTVDGPTASTRLLTDQTVVPEEWSPVLAIADRILVGRADLLTTEGLDGVAWSLRNGNCLGPISFPALGGVDIGALTGIDAWVGELTAVPPDHLGNEACSTWQTSAPEFACLTDVVHVVQQLLLWCSDRVLRVQGVMPIGGGESVLISGSGSTALTMTAPSIPGENASLTLVTAHEHTHTVRNVLRTLMQTHSIAPYDHERRDH